MPKGVEYKDHPLSRYSRFDAGFFVVKKDEGTMEAKVFEHGSSSGK
jgi:hypothetical protein